MANRRMGGGMNARGNRSFSQPFQGGGVNPWQGNAPNNSGGMLSQITSNPQQLALALTSLLQPQQQMNNPPSLLSLNTSPAFSGDRDYGRFGRGRDMRRHEPYTKNRSGWRSGDKKKNQNKRQNQNKKKDAKKDEKQAEKEEETEETAENGDEKKEGEAGDGKNKEGPYLNVPVKFLNCFVCNKEMWDGESMQKHVKGRAHREMLDSLEESIHITVNILRENMRLAEEKKVIEWHRMQRVSKKFNKFNDMESHCNMCDLKFMGKIVVHRKSEGHQRLKRYLHPNCDTCDKEFPSRMEWVDHRLTPEHLRKLSEELKNKAGGEDGDIIVENDLDIEPLLDEPLQMEVENPILELTDDLTGLQNLMPAYKPDRAVSTQSLTEFSGYRCQLCHRSFHEEDLAQKHLKSKGHYYSFIEAAKAKYQQQQQEKKEKEEKEAKEKEAKEKEEAEENGVKEEVEEEATNDENAMETDEVKVECENEEDEEEQADQGEGDAEIGEEPEPEPEPEPKKVEAKAPAAPATPAPAAPAPATPAPATPARQTRTTTASTPAAKNGAGPKSKKARK